MIDRLPQPGRWPIRWRLTVWYALLFAATMLIFGAGFFILLQRGLREGFDEQLADQAGLLLAVIQDDTGAVTLSGVIEPGDDDLFVRVFDQDGLVTAGTIEALGHPARRERPVRQALRGQIVFANLSIDRERLRLVTIPIRGQDGTITGALQVGLSPEEVDQALAQATTVLAIAAPFALLAAVGAGYLLAGRALRPVTHITDLAAGINAAGLDTRLALDLPNDEIGRLAQTFDAMLARIEESFARQQRFTGDAAHELRTPLSLMRGRVDLALSRDRTAADYQATLRDFDADLSRMTAMVTTLLTLARADAGRLPLDLAGFDLAETLPAVAAEFASIAAERDTTLAVRSTPALVIADEDLVLRVLVNLVENALRHTPAGGSITLGCDPVAGGATAWVEDTGEGIDPALQDRIFDRFTRGHLDRASGSGAGLGLAIGRAIAQAHGGTLTVRSHPGAGARFTLWLPTDGPPPPSDPSALPQR